MPIPTEILQERTIILPNEAATLKLGNQLAKDCPCPCVIFLIGELGAGKTCFVRGFLQGLGYTKHVKSPTYTLVEPYHFVDKMVYHFDLYRLNDPSELEFIGFRDYFSPSSICLIEWPKKAETILPKPDISCYIEHQDSKRIITLQAHTKAIKKTIDHL
ncbi:MAG: tRNA (adenosine(37)-N6)-threonylcarbamoyltransferase complex ATPase subunit type 1 TsaE [Gammaproteobacteria bacterium]